MKHIEQGLWELRMKGKDGIARAFYVTASGQRVVIVQTPRREIDLALARAKEVS